MNIYDLKLYGVYMPRLVGGRRVMLAAERAEVHPKSPREFRFEVVALKQYGTKKDVLWLRFVDGHSEYTTLYEPYMCLDNGEWQSTHLGDVSEAFLAKYNEVKEIEALESKSSIFDFTFYGLVEDSAIKPQMVEISLSRVRLEQCLTKNSVMFTATILKEYKGKKYVIKQTADSGETCYIPLFNANMYYDEVRKNWSYCNESLIPGKIMKCYVKHLSG